jgi:succinate dehydrogenase / fumarate reductase flavoprotein subunit
VHLDLTHLGKKRLSEKLSDISSFVRIYLGLDPVHELIPVQPTCHYMMGGIPANLDGQVLGKGNQPVPGLFAAGECACVSVHGANRLGCNSLLDLVVFGRRAGRRILEDLGGLDRASLAGHPDEDMLAKIKTLKRRTGGESVGALRQEMQQCMTEHCSVFREQGGLEKALNKIRDLIARYKTVSVQNPALRFNTELMEALELESLLHLAQTIVVSALAREESRGAHFRDDHPERDDESWLKHTMIQKTGKGPRVDYKPVTITRFEPKPRVY